MVEKQTEVLMLKELRSRSFTNGKVYALETEDGYPLEVTDTFYQIIQRTQSITMKTH